MKILGVLIIIISSTSIGIHFSKKLQYRVDDLRQFKKLLIMLRGEIRFSATPLPEALITISLRADDKFSVFFYKVGSELEKLEGNDFKKIWESNIYTYLSSTYLLNSDLERLKQLGDNIGYLDKEMQLNTIDLFLELLEEEITTAISTMNQNSKLYKYLGALGGLLIAIIII